MATKHTYEPLSMTVELQKERKTSARMLFEGLRAAGVSILFLLIMMRITFISISEHLHSTVI
ncbi:MAG: hypothetical protein ACLQVG_25500 [Terriglobia bacterium]